MTDNTDDRVTFTPDETRLSASLARGHVNRKGHELAGYWVTRDGVRTLTRTCCAEPTANE